jgi:hypothetical protein
MTSSRRLFVLCTFLALSAPSVALAQRSAQDIETARNLYQEGTALRDRGDMKGALEKFKAAHALGNTPITGLELCRTYGALKMPVEGREACLSVGRIPALTGETVRSQEARNEAARYAEELRPQIAHLRLRIRLQGQPTRREPTVTIDGAQIPVAALGEPRALDPGQHQISAKVGSGVATSVTLETREGETKDVELIVQVPVDDTPPPPPPPGGGTTPPPEKKGGSGGIILLGIGGAGLALGLIAGGVALSDKSDLDKKCTSSTPTAGDKICGREDHATLDHAKTWAGVSTASFIIGGLFLAGGLAATLVSAKSSAKPNKPHVTPIVGLGGVGVDGSF